MNAGGAGYLLRGDVDTHSKPTIKIALPCIGLVHVCTPRVVVSFQSTIYFPKPPDAYVVNPPRCPLRQVQRSS